MGLLYNLADPEFEYSPTDWLQPLIFSKSRKRKQMQRLNNSDGDVQEETRKTYTFKGRW